jgi:aspartate/methionine/tyrosine aminotransferase
MTGLIAASPANPTGSIMKPDVLRELIDFAVAKGAFVVSDEIYQGLEYDGLARSALAYSRDVFVINSFSKYFGMTGWRLGWAVVPEPAIDGAERLAQNLFISAPTLSQRAALAAFEPENMRELERRRQVFAARREVLCAGLSRLGFAIRARPQGAFYVYADAGGLTTDTQAFAMNLLELAGVAVTPGRDFGIHHPERFLRFCYTAPVERIEEALARLERFIRERA